jgi:ABC-2 type transport system permease protein
MKVLLRELKFYRKGLVFWCLGMVALIWSSMVKYDTFQSSGQSITELLEQFPQSIQTIFGMTGFDLTQASGFYGVMFMYIALTAAIHAVMLGAGIVSKEERDRTSEFLYVKPITRSKVMSSKLVAGFTNILVFNLVTYVSSIYFVDMYNRGESISQDILLLMLGLMMIQLIFFFVGALIASISRRPKLSTSIASAVLLATFIMTYLINFNSDFDFLKVFTPFMYFDAKSILGSGSLQVLNVVSSLVLIVVMTVVTYTTYNKRDLEV